MKKQILFIIALLLLLSCKKETEDSTNLSIARSDVYERITVDYATNYTVDVVDNGYLVSFKNGTDSLSQYLFTRDAAAQSKATIIKIPIKNLVATSTTHITPLDLLGETVSLKGFPETDFISNKKIRKLIDAGAVTELGMNNKLNVEATISLQPDVVMGFEVGGANPSYVPLTKAGIPVLINSDWTENHPLGRAEWLKLYGILYDKVTLSDSIFNSIKTEYNNAKNLVSATDRPTVIAGASWKDVWYLPYGDSWQGQLIKDAGAAYVYEDSRGVGSLSYSLERVLTDAQDADYWIAPGQYSSYNSMTADLKAYDGFKSFRQKNVYTFATTVGDSGGVIYYEEATTRPDLVLKDLIKIFHPEKLPDYKSYFFKPLKD